MESEYASRIIQSDLASHSSWEPQYHNLRTRLLRSQKCSPNYYHPKMEEDLGLYFSLRQRLALMHSQKISQSYQLFGGEEKNASSKVPLNEILQHDGGEEPPREEPHTSLFLSQLNLPEVGVFGGQKSKCTTNTQDVEMDSPSSSSSSLPSSDGEGQSERVDSVSFVKVSSAHFSDQDALESTKGGFFFSRSPLRIDPKMGTVTCLEFNRRDGMLAAGTARGVVLLFPDATTSTEMQLLEGHNSYVTDVAWSDSAQYLLSVSLDSFAIAWDALKRTKVRQIPLQNEPLVAKFLPKNNNFFLVGLRGTSIRVFNLSTGMLVRRVRCVASVGAMAVNSCGTEVFTGDAQGSIAVYVVQLENGTVKRATHLTLPNVAPVTSLEWQPASTGNGTLIQSARMVSLLLANVQNNSVFVLASEKSGEAYKLCLLRQVFVAQRKVSVRSAFCSPDCFGPTVSFVTGSEDGHVYVYSLTAENTNLVDEVYAGKCGVIDVSWGPESAVLAAGTTSGSILLWRRIVVSGSQVDSSKFFVENCRPSYGTHGLNSGSNSSPREAET